MLTNSVTTQMIPVRDVARAKDFYYQARLGLAPSGETPDGGYAFATAGGHMIALLPDADGAPSGRTMLSFEVPDLEKEVQDLESGGIVFEDYDTPEITTTGHIARQGNEAAAWFKDSEGNVLCLHSVG
ncbi:putative enzyme related to lactoylglutathione lyase [Mumia flava]|uniref:Putative enzyme related to lactoylglutathione lyase n=1 Tax=Mumia flava TaxID=1348852 RepID=A0A0B2BJK5_9ACTN|nr:VOC family protein [Mumia flava]PJJ57415.1 putative enzyme related to lactoylglutathione lyase [Mumia flava]